MFRKVELQEVMDNSGFCLIDVLDNEAISKLQELYQISIAPNVDKDFYANHNSQTESAWDISQQITSIIDNCFQKVFNDFEFFVAHFSVKRALSHYEFHLHQDWSIVDESKYKSYQVWIPLCNVSPENGSLYLIKNSHKALPLPRSNTLGIPIVQADDILKKYTISTYLATGQAVVFQNNVLHGSYPNNSDADRVGIIVNIIEKNAPTIFFHFENNNLKKYQITAKTLLNNLIDLEKQIVPQDFELISEEPFIPSYSSAELDATSLLNRFQNAGLKTYDKTIFSILQDEQLQRELDFNGYVIVDNLSQEVIEKLSVINYEYQKSTSNDKMLSISLEDAPIEIKRKIHQEIEMVVSDELSSVFKDYKYPIFTTFSKSPSEDSEVVLHTDTALLINGMAEAHYGIWIPLDDVDEHNGALSLIPGSHHWYNAPVCIGQDWPFGSHVDYIQNLKVAIPLKKGQFVIFDNRLIHGSYSNLSDKYRNCVVGRVTHQLSQYYNLYAENDGFVAYKRSDTSYLEEQWKDKNSEHPLESIGFFKSAKFDSKLFPALVIDINKLSKKYQYNGIDKWALSELDLKIYEGQCVGLIGSNGSGKSTLLNILSGIVKPSSGSASILGKVVSVLDIGSNFHPDLTGIENAKLFLKFHNVPSSQFEIILQEAREFSELGEYFDQPVKTYSKGMFLRLSFSVMFKIEADIYLIDEVMSMGDEAFRLKTAAIFDVLKQKNKTILLASHDRIEILRYCDISAWLDNGVLKKLGSTHDVLKEYSKFQYSRYYHSMNQNLKNEIWLNKKSKYFHQFDKDGYGNELLRILSIGLKSKSGIIQREEDFEIKLHLSENMSNSISVMIKLSNEFSQPVLISSDIMSEVDLQKSEQNIWICKLAKNILTAGDYTLDLYFGKIDRDNHLFSERFLAIEDLIQFTIESKGTEIVGVRQHCSIQMPLNWTKL